MTTPLSLVICVNRRFGMTKSSCAGSGSEAMADELERLLAEHCLNIEVTRVKCLGQCELGPNLRIAPAGRFYYQLSMDELPDVIAELQRLSQSE